MADRRVTATRKDNDGYIIALGNPSETWSPRLKSAAVYDIVTETHKYYVIIDGKRIDINVVNGLTGTYIRTDPDRTARNILDELPDCK